MVEITVKRTFEGEEKALIFKPCQIAFIVGLNNEEEKHATRSQMAVIGGLGLKKADAVDALADSTVEMLVGISEDSRRQQAKILAAYMECFTKHAMEKTGTIVMDEVEKMIKE